MLLGLTHMCFPRARRHTRKFFELSYYNPESGEYCAGWNDAFMVFYWIVIFTGLRAAIMDYVLMPFAKMLGVKTARDQTRFVEQAWLLVYYSVFWTLGMVSPPPPLPPFYQSALNLNSTCGSLPTICLTSKSSGRTGPIGKWQGRKSSTY